MKDKDYINQINDLLNELENNINLISFESIYYSIMVISQKICGLTVEFQLKKANPKILENNMRPFQMIHMCREENIIPHNQIKNLEKMRKLNNMVIHGKQLVYLDVYYHLNSFSKYITWFDSSCLDNYFMKTQLRTKSLISKINSLPQPQKNETKKDNHVKSTNGPDLNKIYKDNGSKLTKQEEVHCINQINKQLTEYENQLTLISPGKNYYFVFVGQNIIESMLKLLIKKGILYF